MNFSGISNQELLGKILRFPLKFIPTHLPIPILQGRLRGRRWIAGSSNHGCWLGSYEYRKRLVFEKLVTEGSIVFDIGAHVGFYTLLAAVLVGDRGRVFAFEPLPRNLLYLRKHLRLNRIKNVIVIEAAVLDWGRMVFFNEGQSSSMAHVASQGKVRVKAVSLDELLAKGELPTPTHIKIDVEGSEMQVLLGAKLLLTSSHPYVFLTTHGEDIHRQCCQFLIELGYRLRPIGADRVEQTDEILADCAPMHHDTATSHA